MIKRLVWFCIGTGFGFWLAVRLGRTVRESVERYTPEQLAGRLAGATAGIRQDVRAAVAEGPGGHARARGGAALEGQLIDPLDSGHGRGSEM